MSLAAPMRFSNLRAMRRSSWARRPGVLRWIHGAARIPNRPAFSRRPLGPLVALFAWGLTSHRYHALVGFLFLLGIFAGLFVVPFVAWLQKASARDEKGLIISTANLFDMAAVLAASGALWLLHDVLDIDARVILLVGGVATLLYVGAMQLLW